MGNNEISDKSLKIAKEVGILAPGTANNNNLTLESIDFSIDWLKEYGPRLTKEEKKEKRNKRKEK